MSVLTGKALHEQLSVIMGALAKAAVVEICGVVDEGFAVLQMEIMRSHKENEDLKKKLHLIESIVVRSGKGTEAAAEEALQRQYSDGGAGATVEVQQEVNTAAGAHRKRMVDQFSYWLARMFCRDHS